MIAKLYLCVLFVYVHCSVVYMILQTPWEFHSYYYYCITVRESPAPLPRLAPLSPPPSPRR